MKTFIQFILLQALFVILAATVAPRARRTQQGLVARYGLLPRCIVLFALALLFFMIWSVLSGDPKAPVKDWRVPAVLGVICTILSVEGFFRKICLSDSQIILISPWSGKTRLSLTDIRKIRYFEVGEFTHYIITTPKGDFSVPGDLDGSVELISRIRQT